MSSPTTNPPIIGSGTTEKDPRKLRCDWSPPKNRLRKLSMSQRKATAPSPPPRPTITARASIVVISDEWKGPAWRARLRKARFWSIARPYEHHWVPA